MIAEEELQELMRLKIKYLVLSIASLIFTGWGIYLLITGDLTNGLLALIMGELIDIPRARIHRPNS